MFKKVLSILIAAVMAMSLFSCEEDTTEPVDNDSGKKRKPKVTGTAGTDDTGTGFATGIGTEDEWEIPDDNGDNYDGDLKMYSDYLLGGKLDTIISENYLEDPSLHYCLIDMNEDGTYELLLSLANTKNPGPRGYASIDYLFGIVNGRVTELKYEYNGGGTMGGSGLSIKYDEVKSRHTVVTTGLFRDGIWAGFGVFAAYEYDGSEVSSYINAESTYLNLDEGSHAAESYADIINEVKSSNSYYKEDDTSFYCYELDGRYVSEDDYNKATKRFIEPEDSRFIMKEGTVEDPFGLK